MKRDVDVSDPTRQQKPVSGTEGGHDEHDCADDEENATSTSMQPTGEPSAEWG